MGNVVPLRPGLAERLAMEIRTDLRRTGSAESTAQEELGVPLAEWRRIARRVAHRMDRPVVTHESHGRAVAVLTGWPANELERELDARQLLREPVGVLTVLFD